MNRSILNYFIDIGLAITFFAVFITGILKFRELAQLFGYNTVVLPVKELSTIHDWSGLIMGILVLIHLILHWNWLKCMTKGFFKTKEEKCDV
jgi:cytochrome b subunit of formate dehydrogenase